jgi:hypothetical protein
VSVRLAFVFRRPTKCLSLPRSSEPVSPLPLTQLPFRCRCVETSSNDWRRLFLKRGRTGVGATPASGGPCTGCRGACKGLQWILFLGPWLGGVSENLLRS